MAVRSHNLFRAFVLLATLAVPVSAEDDHPSRHFVSTPVGTDAESKSDRVQLTASHAIEGFTEPYADIQLAASELGTLSAIAVEEGDTVKAGHVIASLDDRVLKASLDIAFAAAKAEGELVSAAANVDMREAELEKLTELFSRHHASQQELDRVEGDLKVAKARLKIVQEEAIVRELECERIRAQLKQRKVVSPIDGTVVEVMKEKGEFVSPSDPIVARVVQLDPVLVAFSVPASQRKLLTKNQPVLMTIGAVRKVSGRVEFVSPLIDASSGTFRVKIVLPNSDGRWMSGEKSVLHLDSSSIQQATQIDRLAKQSE